MRERPGPPLILQSRGKWIKDPAALWGPRLLRSRDAPTFIGEGARTECRVKSLSHQQNNAIAIPVQGRPHGPPIIHTSRQRRGGSAAGPFASCGDRQHPLGLTMSSAATQREATAALPRKRSELKKGVGREIRREEANVLQRHQVKARLRLRMLQAIRHPITSDT